MSEYRQVSYSAVKARESGIWPDAIPLSHVVFSTGYYEQAHWEKPRGTGYWGFYVSGNRIDMTWGRKYEPARLVWLQGAARTFTEARAEIIQYAAERGLRYIEVAP